MARSSLDYIDNTNVIIGALLRSTPRASAKAAELLADRAGLFSAVDTTSARHSWYAVGAGVDGYANSLAISQAVNRRAQIVQKVDPTNKNEAVVSHSIVHPFFLEFGTVSMRAQPALQPAIESAKEDLVSMMKREIDIELAGVRSR